MEYKNTFNGLNKDSAINNYPNGNYYEANNIRISENDTLTDGVVTNYKGNDVNYYIPEALGTTRIIGECAIRDKIILFIVNSLSVGYIGYFDKSDVVTSNFNIIYSDITATGSLGFSEDYPITAIGRYESETVQKIYWTDNNYKSLRYMNIMSDSLSSKEPTYFDIVPSITFSQPKITNIGNGSLKAGTIQYAYQLYRNEGAESNFSITSKLISLANSSVTATTDKDYKGAEKDTQVGKSVTISISDLDTVNYDRIRIVSIFYNSLYDDPDINIVYEGALESSMTFVDGGNNSLGSYTIEEFRLFESTLFTAKTLKVKNDIIFAGNITENNFDVDYDARAYRFLKKSHYIQDGTDANSITTGSKIVTIDTGLKFFSSGITAMIKYDDYNYMIGNITDYNSSTGVLTVNVTSITGSGTYNLWEVTLLNYTIAALYQSDGSYYRLYEKSWGLTWNKSNNSNDNGTDFDLPETIDAIDSFNSSRLYDIKYGFKRGTNDLGGSGTNVSYTFKIYSTCIDSRNDATYYASPKASKTLFHTLPNGEENFSYGSAASPVNIRGFQRDETYRFGIVFYDSRGRSSFVKWIGDIRMPKAEDINETATYIGTTYNGIINVSKYDFKPTTYVYDANDGTGKVVLNANYLYPEFTVTNIPTDDDGNKCSWRIVYVKRDSNNKTVVAQGVWGGLDSGDTTNDNDNKKPRAFFLADSLGKGLVKRIYEWNQFISPEINFGIHDTVIAGDYIVPVTYGMKSTYNQWERTDSLDTDSPALNANGEDTDTDIRSTVFKYGSFEPLSKRRDQRDYPVYTWNDGNIIVFDIEEGKKMSPNEVWTGDVSGKTYQNRTETEISIDDIKYWGYGGTCLFLKTSSAPKDRYGNLKYSTHWGFNGTEALIVNYKRILSGQYGGNTYSARQYNEYIPCSPLYSGDTSTGIPDEGDTYIAYFDHLKVMYEEDLDTIDGYNSMQETLLIPLETTINLTLRHDSYVNKLGYRNAVRLNEDNVKDVDKEDTGALYKLNSAYLKVNDSIVYYSKPLDWESETSFDTRIKYSDIKINRDSIDGWTKFRTGNFKDVENQYGAITKLVVYNNQLVFFQEKAFGILAVNERELLKSSNIGTLTLGTGGILDRYDYISTLTGTLQQWSVLITMFGMFWYDYNNNEFYKYIQGSAPEPLFTSKRIKSYMRGKTFSSYDIPQKGNGVLAGYDHEYKQVLLTSKNSSSLSDEFTIVYDCAKGIFSSFIDALPIRYIDFNSKLYSISSSYKNKIYSHNTGDPACFYGTYHSSDITMIVNPYPDKNKKYQVIEYNAEFKDLSGNTYLNNTFTNIKVWNSYQDTGTMKLTLNDNVIKKWRKWRINTLRDSLDSTNTEPKIRDTYAFLKFSYSNDEEVKKTFKLTSVITKYSVVPL